MSAAALVQDLEEKLARIYRFPLVTSAVPFLMTEDQVIKETIDVKVPRAAVFLIPSEDSLEIGIFIQQQLFDVLNGNDPNKELNQTNLDAYCVLIEELSHFHLLLQRSQDGRGVSQLELEWQGEIDKLLIAGLLMSEQRQESCFRSLHQKIFEESTLSSDPVYQEASHYAAKCWHRLLPKCSHLHLVEQQIVPILQSTYQANWGNKIRIIQGL